jgi:hypothetical protein
MRIIVTAKYEGEIDKQRIHAVFERCGVCMFRPSALPGAPQYEVFKDGPGDEEITIGFSDVRWNSNFDLTKTLVKRNERHKLEIFVGDSLKRAIRLAAELRACGMMVAIATEQQTDFEAKLQSFYEGCQRIAAEKRGYKNKHWSMTRLKRWVRIEKETSAFCFVDLETGEVLKTGGRKRPALTKTKRGNIFDEHNGLKHIGPHGVAYADEIKGTRQQWTVK